MKLPKIVFAVLAIIYVYILVVSFKGQGYVGYSDNHSYSNYGVTYIHTGQSVRQGSVGGVGQRNGGAGGK